jgi:hypothetical protein
MIEIVLWNALEARHPKRWSLYSKSHGPLCRLLGSNFVTPIITTTTLSKLDSFERLFTTTIQSIGGLIMFKLLCSTRLKLLTYKLQSSSFTIGQRTWNLFSLTTSPCTSFRNVRKCRKLCVLVKPHNLELIPLWMIRAKKKKQYQEWLAFHKGFNDGRRWKLKQRMNNYCMKIVGKASRYNAI